MYSKTNINHDNNNITLSRLIDSRLVKVIFNDNIQAVKLIPYFNMKDEDFKKFLR